MNPASQRAFAELTILANGEYEKRRLNKKGDRFGDVFIYGV